MDVKNVEIFKVGTWRGNREVTVTPAMLSEMAANFKEINSVPGYGVPVKLGHSKGTGDPAFGWVTDVREDGTTMSADFGDVPPEIVDAIGKRRYNSTSIELMPKVSFNGKEFKNVLAGVALLGAEWPAVKGMKPLSAAQFAEHAETLELSMAGNETAIFNQAQSDALVLAAEQRVRTEMQALLSAEGAKVTAAETRATVAESALKVAQKDGRTALFSAAIDDAIAKGILLPKQKETTLAFAQNFPDEVKVGDKSVKAIDAFKEWIAGLPQKVSFSEKGITRRAAPAGDVPAGKQNVADAVNEAVQAHMREKSMKPSQYEEALTAVFAANPELKQAYASEMN